MSNKNKIIGITALVLGIGLISSGIGFSLFINNSVYYGVPLALLTVKEEGIPIIKDIVEEYAIPFVLLGINDYVSSEIEKIFNDLSIPDVLWSLKNLTFIELPGIINATIAAQMINWTLDPIAQANDWSFAQEQFFNNESFEPLLFGSPFSGISNYTGKNCSFSQAAQQAILINGIEVPSIANVSGLINDTMLGTCVLGFLNIYERAEGDQPLNTTIQGLYNANWTQLSWVNDYLKNYLYPQVPNTVLNLHGMTIDQFKEYMFYSQWANATIAPDGFDLSLLSNDLNYSVFGFEAGIPNPTNISYISAKALFDPLNSSAFINHTGIQKWIDARDGDVAVQAELMSTFHLTQTQLTMILDWLFITFQQNVFPIFFALPEPIGKGMTITEFSEILFYEQWANGTILGEVLFPGGFDLLGGSELPLTLTGVEVGVPIPSNISLFSAEALFDPLNSSSFTNSIGFEKWIDAENGDSIIQTELKDTFNLTQTQLTMLLEWMFTTIRRLIILVIPQPEPIGLGISLSKFSENLLYEQWANGTILGEVYFPGGIDIGELLEWGISIVGWEVGVPDPTGMSLETVEALYDEKDPLALANQKGIRKWYTAVKNPDSKVYSELQDGFDLSDSQMEAIIEWLPVFRDEILPLLVKYVFNLPTDPYTLATLIMLALVIPGGVVTALGGVALYLLKKKTSVE